MSILREFKEFAIKGNVVDLAVGVIIGAAFGKIVASFVADLVMPPLGLLIGGVNFTDLAVTLRGPVGTTPAVLWKYGTFLQTCLDFTIISLVIFLAVKAINKMKKKADPVVAPPSRQEVLLEEIRDLLAKKKLSDD